MTDKQTWSHNLRLDSSNNTMDARYESETISYFVWECHWQMPALVAQVTHCRSLGLCGRSGGLDSNPGSGGLSVHAGQLRAYSETSISGRQLEPGLRAPGPLVWAGVGITNKASSGTISSARPQRNRTYKLSTSPSIFPPPLHTLHTWTASKSGSRSTPLTPGYTPYPTFPFWQGLHIGPS